MKRNITDNESLHTFFLFVSKAVLIIPIFILIVSLFFKFSVPKNSPSLSIAVSPTAVPVVKNNDFKFDLKGPIVCENLFIQNKKVLLINKLTNYLLNGDCLYIWEKGKTAGEKKCGLSNYVNMVENYLGLFDINDILNNDLVKDKIKNKDINLENIIKSCKRIEIKDKNIFQIPINILFTNKL